MREDTLKKIIFSFITFLTLSLYIKTTAPTVVFWDVGEFLAVSYILGVPHPPGTPLYVILGRFFTLLPIPFLNVVQKITLISMLSSAFTVGFGYLILLKVFNRISKKIPVYAKHLSAATGAVIGGFSYTTWWSTIEAEVYAPSVFFIVFCIYLLFLWWERKNKKDSIRYLILVFYLVALSTGIHLLAVIILPVFILFIYLIKKEELLNFKFFGTIGALFITAGVLRATYKPYSLRTLIAFFIIGFVLLYLSMWEKDKNKASFEKLIFEFPHIVYILFFILTIIAVFQRWIPIIVISGVLGAIWGFVYSRLYIDARGFTFLMMLIAVTPEFYLLIRSRFDLRINQVEPRTWQRFWDVLSRKQYEPMNLFPRRTSKVQQGMFFATPVYNQFWAFIDQIWGFLYYFSWQFIPLIVILGIIGIVAHIYSDWKSFILVGGGLFMGTLGLIIGLNLKYPSTFMNFLKFIEQFPGFLYSSRIRELLSLLSGGGGVNISKILQTIPTEVRDRDYFFIPGYIFFGFYAGIGLFEIIRLAYKNLNKKILKIAPYFFTLFGIFVPLWQIKTFYFKADRSKNYIAEDYAYNLLSCVDDGGILFTNGDNDTFPLWFLQSVYGYKKSVIVANLSLLNTDWYNIQLKRWGVPIHFSEEDLRKLAPFRLPDGNIILVRDLIIRSIIAGVFGYKFSDDVKDYYTLESGVAIPKIFFLEGDKFMEEVISKARNKEPVPPLFFSITCERRAFKPFSNYLVMEGFVLRVKGERVKEIFPPLGTGFDVKKTEEYVNKVFRYRGILKDSKPDFSVYKDLTHERLLGTYRALKIYLGAYYDYKGDIKKAIKYFEDAEVIRGHETGMDPDEQKGFVSIKLFLAEMYKRAGMYDKAIIKAQEVLKNFKAGEAYRIIAESYIGLGKLDKAEEYLNKAFEEGAKDPYLILTLISFNIAKGDTKRAMELIRKLKSTRGIPFDIMKEIENMERSIKKGK